MPFFNDERYNAYIIHRDIDTLTSVCHTFDITEDRILALSSFDKNSEIIVDLILIDNRSTDRYLYDKLKDIAPVIAIDEGGDARDLIPYTIDTLPNLLETKPNYFNTGLLNITKGIKKEYKNSPKRILISFGGQDPYNLTEWVVDRLMGVYNLEVVVGPLFKNREFPVPVLEGIDDLKKVIQDYDLVITSFGITAFEAVSLGVPVALLNPTEYHKDLSLKAGFYTLDKTLKLDYKKAVTQMEGIPLGKNENLTDLIFNISISQNGCPICKEASNEVLERFLDKTYHTCKHCSITYMTAFTKEREYESDYFFKEYSNQYGKTYLEDFEHIQSMGGRRLLPIKTKVLPDAKLLDVGCAYGPFLKAAEELGYKPYGVDISQDAITYIKNSFNYEVLCSPFPYGDNDIMPNKFSVVTMWYVIEHFKDLGTVLSSVNHILDKGGVFAFSTPNVRGVSGRKNLKNFLKCSPNDHYTIFDPVTAGKVLKNYGFKVYNIEITGHHPERFNRYARKGLLKHFFLLISKIFRLGDTFEIYCIKEHSL